MGAGFLGRNRPDASKRPVTMCIFEILLISTD
jgi:hypothetical protein